MTADLHQCLDTARAALRGEVTSTSRVVDALLDLRTAANELGPAAVDVVAAVDAALASIPGRSVVPNDWCREQLAAIERRADSALHTLPSR